MGEGRRKEEDVVNNLDAAETSHVVDSSLCLYLLASFPVHSAANKQKLVEGLGMIINVHLNAFEVCRSCNRGLAVLDVLKMTPTQYFLLMLEMIKPIIR